MSCPDCGTKTGADWRFCADCLVARMGQVRNAQERAEERRDTLDNDEEEGQG